MLLQLGMKGNLKKTLVIVFVAILCLSMFSIYGSKVNAQQSAVDWWPMFHHDLTHTGYSTSTGPLTNKTLTLWTFAAYYSVSSSPAVLDGVVYVGSDNGNMYAVNAATG